ncbi:MAG: hypothetical protein PHE61_06635, partial [Candidatus Omnitrophica bacterium]|nr:hypothetical protein [Candidatus Omnitrophota bacterium]
MIPWQISRKKMALRIISCIVIFFFASTQFDLQRAFAYHAAVPAQVIENNLLKEKLRDILDKNIRFETDSAEEQGTQAPAPTIPVTEQPSIPSGEAPKVPSTDSFLSGTGPLAPPTSDTQTTHNSDGTITYSNPDGSHYTVDPAKESRLIESHIQEDGVWVNRTFAYNDTLGTVRIDEKKEGQAEGLYYDYTYNSQYQPEKVLEVGILHDDGSTEKIQSYDYENGILTVFKEGDPEQCYKYEFEWNNTSKSPEVKRLVYVSTADAEYAYDYSAGILRISDKDNPDIYAAYELVYDEEGDTYKAERLLRYKVEGGEYSYTYDDTAGVYTVKDEIKGTTQTFNQTDDRIISFTDEDGDSFLVDTTTEAGFAYIISEETGFYSKVSYDGESLGELTYETGIRISGTFIAFSRYDYSISGRVKVENISGGQPTGEYQVYELNSDGSFGEWVEFVQEDSNGDMVYASRTLFADGSSQVVYTNLNPAHAQTITENYDKDGNLVVSNVSIPGTSSGGLATYEYENGVLVRRIDSNGTVTHYDSKGNVILVEMADDTTIQVGYKYDQSGNITEISYEYSDGSIEFFNSAGVLESKLTEDGLLQEYTYNDAGEITQIRVSNPVTQTLLMTVSYEEEITEAGEVRRIETTVDYENDQTIKRIYNAAGELLEASVEADGYRQVFDADGVLLSTTTAEGITTYYENGLIKRIVDAQGNILRSFTHVIDPETGEVIEVKLETQETVYSNYQLLIDGSKRIVMSNGVVINIGTDPDTGGDIITGVTDINGDESVTYQFYSEDGDIVIKLIYGNLATIYRFTVNTISDELVLKYIIDTRGNWQEYFYYEDSNADLDYVKKSDGTILRYYEDENGVVILYDGDGNVSTDGDPRTKTETDRLGNVKTYYYTTADDAGGTLGLTDNDGRTLDLIVERSAPTAELSNGELLSRTHYYYETQADGSLVLDANGNPILEHEEEWDEEGNRVSETFYEDGTMHHRVSYSDNKEGVRVPSERIDYNYTDGELTSATQWDVTEIADLQTVRTSQTPVGELKATQHFKKTIYDVLILDWVENVDGSYTLYNYDDVGQGILKTVENYDPLLDADGNSRTDKDSETGRPLYGLLTSKTFFRENSYGEDEAWYSINYKEDVADPTLSVPSTQTVYIYDSLSRMQQIRTYKINGEPDIVSEDGSVSPAEGDQADTLKEISFLNYEGELTSSQTQEEDGSWNTNFFKPNGLGGIGEIKTYSGQLAAEPPPTVPPTSHLILDSDGNPVRSLTYNADGTVESTNFFGLIDGKVREIRTYDGLWETEPTTGITGHVFLDENGDPIRSLTYDSEGNVESTNFFGLIDGKVREIRTYDGLWETEPTTGITGHVFLDENG